MTSDDGKIQFLHKVDNKIHSSTIEKRTLGSSTPLFRKNSGGMMATANFSTGNKLAAVMEEKLSPIVATVSSSGVMQDTDCTGNSDSSGSTLQRVVPAIHMDAMAFGMGCCCLQVTFQAEDLDESRFIYDQLAVLAPIMMALTASTPILKGRIADTDCRWGIISESVDCRTPAERGLSGDKDPEMAGKGVRRIYKSRYDSISTYIYQGMGDSSGYHVSSNGVIMSNNSMANRILNAYNDIPVPIDEESYKLLREAGIDPALSQHIAHLFIRDPLVMFEGSIEEIDDATMTEHFESIQSTNWQTVRWKPPPPRFSPNDPHIGWRVEFRSMEMQLTDFENAAFTAFIVLLTRVIITFDLNLYIPMSRVDANMQRAHSRNASAKGKFFFRRHLAPLEEGDDGYGVTYTSMFSRVAQEVDTPAATSERMDDYQKRNQAPWGAGGAEENSFEEMKMAEIMNGKGDYFPGLIPLVFAYLEHINCDEVTLAQLTKYLDFISKRASGELITPATWMRKYVRSHKGYKSDSVVTEEIAYDLMTACNQIGQGKLHIPELLGDVVIDPVTTAGAYDVKLESKRVQNHRILELLRRYSSRKSFNPNNPSN